MLNYREHISINSETRFGKPCINGSRISVDDVLSWYANGMITKEIIEDFPELSEVQLQACLAYAVDKERKSMSISQALF